MFFYGYVNISYDSICIWEFRNFMLGVLHLHCITSFCFIEQVEMLM